MTLLAAAVQMTSGPDLEANLDTAERLVARAAAQGASLVALPENFALMTAVESDRRRAAERIVEAPGARAAAGPIIARMSALAQRHGLHLVLGGMPERIAEPEGPRDAAPEDRVHNACVVVGPDGDVLAVYRKIHLFDVHIPDGASYRESQSVAPGDRTVVCPTPFGGLGLSVCYDLRFPELYRSLSAAGARVLVVPAAFTQHTGRDHWHVLLRARAIENLAFVVAPAQVGRHDERRVTFGHSLIVEPWGTVLADCADGEGVAIAELDFARQDRLRGELPALDHRRL